MSLINDALRRAKEAQRQTPPPPSPQMQFRPVEPAQPARHGLGLIVPAALAVAGLLVLFFIWQWAQGRTSAGPREVRALTAPAAQATTAPQVPPPSVVATAPVPAAEASPSPQPGSRPGPATGIANPPAVTVSVTPAAPLPAKEQESKVTHSAAITPPPPPKSAPLRLQGIVFNPRRPSVFINGRTLFVGDKLGDSRVVAINQNSATLVGAGKTNVLSMPE
jgi:hypothetical protein